MKMSCRVLGVGTLAFVAGMAHAQNNWITANGGDARRSCFVDVAGPAAATIRWQGVRPTAFTRPFLVVDDRVYICWINPANIADTRVVALDRRTGAEAWAIEVPNPAGYQFTYSRPAAYVNGRLIVTRADGYTRPARYYALDPADGSIVWTSDILVMEAQFQSPTVAPDGDLIAQSRPAVTPQYNAVIARIDAETGDTVWSAPNVFPIDDSNGAVALNGKVYAWENLNFISTSVTAYDLTSGARLYSSPQLNGQGGSAAQQCLFAGPDGTIFAPRAATQNAPWQHFALEDTGSALQVRWSAPGSAGTIGAFGVGSDGSAYLPGSDGTLYRYDGVTGATLANTESPLPPGILAPAMTIDRNGSVYVTTSDPGRLYAFDSALDPLWDVQVPQYSSRPVLGPEGEIFVQTNAGMMAFQTERPACDPDFNCDGNADQDDVICMINAVAGNPGCECQDPDFNRDGNVDQEDVAKIIDVVAGGPCD